MTLLPLQLLSLWLLAGIGFWGGFVALGFRFVEPRGARWSEPRPAVARVRLRAVLVTEIWILTGAAYGALPLL